MQFIEKSPLLCCKATQDIIAITHQLYPYTDIYQRISNLLLPNLPFITENQSARSLLGYPKKPCGSQQKKPFWLCSQTGRVQAILSNLKAILT
jgi:hypothetical protein